MLIITKESVHKLIQRLENPEETEACEEEIARMLEIKQTLLWRAEAARSSCSCVPWQLMAQLTTEVQLLERALEAIDSDDSVRTASILDDYIQQLQT
jgi:hypothetical protein